MSKPSRADMALELVGVLALAVGLLIGVLIELCLIPILFAAKWGRALARRIRAHQKGKSAREDAWLRRD